MRKLVLITTLALLLGGCQNAESPSQTASHQATGNSDVPAATQASAATPNQNQNCTLSVGWDPWEPYHFAAAGSRVQGLDVDLLEAMAEGADCKLDWVQGSWASMLQLIAHGDLDMLLGATMTPERAAFAYFSQPYREESFRVHVRGGDEEKWTSDSLADLMSKGFRLGLTSGYIYGDEVNAVLDNSSWQEQLVEVPVGDLNFMNLMDFRIDGFMEDPFVAASISHRRNWGVPIATLPLELYSGDVHVMFSQASVDEAIVERFDAALAGLRAEGVYDQILERYRQQAD